MKLSTYINHKIGQRVGDRRRGKSVSVEKLAQELGVNWQQIQKYEAGANRIPAARLFLIASFLDEPLADFFPSEHEIRCQRTLCGDPLSTDPILPI